MFFKIQRRPTMPLYLIVLLTVMIHPGLASASALADSVVRLSPLGEIARQSPAMMRQGIRDGLVASGQVDPFIAETIANISSRAFSAERMRLQLVADLDRGMEQKALQQVQDWYRSHLGERISREESGAVAPSAWETMASRSSELREQYRGTERQRLFSRYDRASRATESAVNTAVAVQVALLRAMSAVRGDAPSAGILEETVRAHRKRIEKQVREEVYSAYLNMYESFSNEELKRYLAFLESSHGQRFTSVAGASIHDAIMEPVASIGTQLARWMGPRP